MSTCQTHPSRTTRGPIEILALDMSRSGSAHFLPIVATLEVHQAGFVTLQKNIYYCYLSKMIGDSMKTNVDPSFDAALK